MKQMLSTDPLGVSLSVRDPWPGPMPGTEVTGQDRLIPNVQKQSAEDRLEMQVLSKY
jgi:hypothetical protein